MAELSEWCLRSGQYLGEISALCFLHLPPRFSSPPYLLAGTGSQLLLCDLKIGKIIKSFQVFEGIRVHGISCSSVDSTEAFKIAVFGERRVKIFSLTIETVLRFQNQSGEGIHLSLSHSLPKFSHWVLDVCFLEDNTASLHKQSRCLAVGCSNNSVCLWDISKFSFIQEVRCPERCLLYSMRMWGDKVEALRIASGTIYNEIIVWKVVPQIHTSSRTSVEDHVNLISTFSSILQLYGERYEAMHVCRLAGHEGSIFRIAWSSDGCKLVSVSDDRSARIWRIHAKREGFPLEVVDSHLVGPVLFGHSARVWDCCIFDSLIITAGEDCTCRAWAFDGTQLKMIKEHIGRGIWRCLYDPNSSLLITAGFDSAIKAHLLHASLSKGLERYAEEVKEFPDRSDVFAIHIPNSSQHAGLMDSKSEYVRCLHFTCEDTLYVATNNGYLYHAKLSGTGDVKWTELLWLGEKVPIVCMDLLSRRSSDLSNGIDDWVAVGDGKGSLTIVRVGGDTCTPQVDRTFTWPAEKERQLLGTYWCKSLDNRFIFTADPRGTLKLWRLDNSVSHDVVKSYDVSLVAEFVSCYGTRIMCLDASFEDEVLVCGDLRGNLILFPLLKDLLVGTSAAADQKLSALNNFKGAHGISSVCSILISRFTTSHIHIRSTGGDGCICYLEYDRDRQDLEFIGMKQVKELSFVRSVFDANSHDALASGNYAIGFASANFIIWNLMSESKVFQVPCGGWRRPHAYYLGDVPELKSCFAFVKDEIIYVHRYWVPNSEREMYLQNFHLQFHGREVHSLCFISGDLQLNSVEKLGPFSKSSWIATGCEDGTVRLTRYVLGVESWSDSKLLGEHVGGSAVRSICYVSKIHMVASNMTSMPNGIDRQDVALEDGEFPCLLISVGAKRVLTSWKQKIFTSSIKQEEPVDQPDNESHYNFNSSSRMHSSISFQWLSSDMPTRHHRTHEIRENSENQVDAAENVYDMISQDSSGSPFPENKKMDLKNCLVDKCENDWRYLAVTAFLVKVAYSRLTVCFVVVACSDATLVLRALILPHRLWFDVASLVPMLSPVLALQHVIIPAFPPSKDDIQTGYVYLVISGSTDGSITFWDLTECIEDFMHHVSALPIEGSGDYRRRPRTGRGSQGGRWWRTLSGSVYKKKRGDGSITSKTLGGTSKKVPNSDSCWTSSKLNPSARSATFSQAIHNTAPGSEVDKDDAKSSEICTIGPLHVLKSAHQSGVNCLHVSDRKSSRCSDIGFLYNILSGGDDQALFCLGFELALPSEDRYSAAINQDVFHGVAEPQSTRGFTHCGRYQIRILYNDKIAAAHSSAVKGIWTDGYWVFSTGLDQRIRCWRLEEHGKLTEHAHLIISVPEPEALDARAFGRNYYQIAVAGRGMQMVEFFASCGMDSRN